MKPEKYKSAWWRSMLELHGSEEAVRQVMRERQARSRLTYAGGGGFAYLKARDPARLKAISVKGGRNGRRKADEADV